MEENEKASQEQDASQEQELEVPEHEFERKVQSEADKRMKGFEQKLRDLEADHRAEIKRMEARLEAERKSAEDRIAEQGVDSLLGEYVAKGELPETNLPPIRDFAKNLYTKNKEVREREARANDALAEAEKREREVEELKNTSAVMKAATSEGVSLSFDEAEAIAKKTKGNMTWATDIIKAKVEQKTTTEKPKPRRPDSSIPSAPGGKLSDLELRQEYIAGKISEETFEKECKERGIRPA